MLTNDEEVHFKKNEKRRRVDLALILALAVGAYFLSAECDTLEWFAGYSRAHEAWELDEFVSVAVFGMFGWGFFALRRWKEARSGEKRAQERNRALAKALSEIKQLRGILPICSSCKKIRDDDGYWQQVEAYLVKHADVGVTHGICPECTRKLYPELLEDLEAEKTKAS